MKQMHKLKLSNKRILITGGSGFIGSYLLESLLKQNSLYIIDNEYRGSNISYLKNKYPKNFKENIHFENLDITNYSKILTSIKKFKPQIVFHLAGIAGVNTVIKNPLKVIDVNLIASYNLAKSLSAINSVEKLVYTSTSEVYGKLAFQLSEEEYTTQGTPYDQRWSYATSKLFAEHIFVAFERKYGISTTILRLFNIFGPRQIGSGAIYEFIKQASKNKPLTVFNDGTQIRAWCFVNDCVNAIRLVTEKGSGIYNVGNPYEPLSSYSLARLIVKITKSKSKIHFKKLKTTDIRLRVPNIEKISKLGFKPKITLEDGIKRTHTWHKST